MYEYLEMMGLSFCSMRRWYQMNYVL